MFLNRFVFLIKGRRQYESIILGIKMLFEKKLFDFDFGGLLGRLQRKPGRNK